MSSRRSTIGQIIVIAALIVLTLAAGCQDEKPAPTTPEMDTPAGAAVDSKEETLAFIRDGDIVLVVAARCRGWREGVHAAVCEAAGRAT